MAEKTADDIFKLIKDENVEYVDVLFCDLPGAVQHFSIPASTFDNSVFEDGLAFDGSSVRGFQSIHESDMMLLPDPTTARIDPFRAAKTLNVNFFVHDPFTREAYSRDPRNVARKAENYLTSTGIADTCYFGAEADRPAVVDRDAPQAGQGHARRPAEQADQDRVEHHQHQHRWPRHGLRVGVETGHHQA